MSKKSKEVSLRSLILLPNLIEAQASPAIIPALTQQLGDDLENLKEKIATIIDTNIKRLESVRHKIIQSTIYGKSQILSKVDDMLKFLKHKKPDVAVSHDKNDLIKISKDIEVLATQNDVVIGQLFDNKKEAKREKYYREQIKNLNEYEDRILNFAESRRRGVERIIDKGYRLIDQLRNEEAKEKSKAETKNLRRELDNCFKEIKRAIR